MDHLGRGGRFGLVGEFDGDSGECVGAGPVAWIEVGPGAAAALASAVVHTIDGGASLERARRLPELRVGILLRPPP